MSSVDTQPPVITLPQSWPLGRSADYTVADPSAGSGQAGSGLSSVRVVITDQQERYPKVHWDEAPSGAAFAGAIDRDGLWADKSQARPGEYLAWVKAADNAGNESFAVGKIRVEGKNPLSGTGAPVITLPSLPTATALPPVPASHPSTGSGQALTPDTSHPAPDTSHPTLFGGQTASSQVTSQTTRFHPPTKPSPIQNRKSEIANLWWGGAAAGAAGAFLAESLRRKKEREKRLEDYQNRPKVESEGKGGRLTGKQIAKAYQAAMQQKRQQEAAAQAARNQAIAAKLTRMEAEEEQQWQQAHAPKPAFDPAKWKQQDYAESARWEAQQAYLRYRQGEWVNPQAAAEKPWWQRAWDGITTTTQKVTSAISSAVAGVLHPPQTGSYKLAAPVKDGPPWWEKIANAAAQVVTRITELSAQVVRAAQDTAAKVVKRVAETAAKTIHKTTELAMSLADATLNRIYGYHGPANPPAGVTGQLWMPLPGVLPSSPPTYILDNYRVDQLHVPVWPSNNECVTAATIQDMNMMQAILADKFGIPQLAHMDLPMFAAAFDAQPLWLLRPPADTPIVGGMMHPYAAAAVMQGHADWLRTNFGCGYRVELTSGNTVDDLIENLKNGYPTSIHISQKMSLFENGKFNNYLALLGGMPHTVTLAGYDATTDTWLILDPSPYESADYARWSTSQLLDKWGRQFLFYPPRFAMTTLIPDTACTPPGSANTPLATPAATPPAPTGTPPATPTAQPSAKSEGGSSVTPGVPAIPTPPTATGTPTPPQPSGQQAPPAMPPQK